MRNGGRGASGGVWLLLSALVLTGCFTTEGLNFVQDTRVEIVTPEGGAEVTPPFELRWVVQDFEVGEGTIGGSGNYFAVFFDRTPMAPGQHLRALGDDACKRTPGCPDEAWLADRFIFVTTDTFMRVDVIPDVDLGDRRARDLHEITIVLMDDRDERIGESAFTVEYYAREGD